jgi:hypothetical protein
MPEFCVFRFYAGFAASVGSGCWLLRERGEKLERSFAHLYETGGMRRLHLRRHANLLKRLLVHVQPSTWAW